MDVVRRLGYGQSGGSSTAAGISYDNDDSGLLADNVQEAIDEVVVIVNGEISRATLAEDALDARIDNEIVARGMADDALQADIDAEVTRATGAESALDTRLDTAETDIDALQAADVALDARLDTAEAEIDQLQLDVTQAQADITQLQSDVTSLDTRLDTAESDINSLETRVTTAEGEINTLQIDVVTAQNAADAAQADIDAHIADTTGAHAASSISNTPAGTISSTDVQGAINELNTDIIAAQADATQALSDAASAQATADQAQSEVDALELTVAQNTADITALDGRIDAIEPYISTGDLSQSSFSITNNTSSPANITGFAFTTRSFLATVSVTISATASLYSEYQIRGIHKGSTWVISYSGTGDDTGVFFDITNAGQLTYICSNYTGFSSGTIKFRAITTGV